MKFPIVTKDDHGIRPAGKPDECFYCHSKVGEPHGRDCVTITKRVRLKATIEFEVEVPHSWEKLVCHRQTIIIPTANTVSGEFGRTNEITIRK